MAVEKDPSLWHDFWKGVWEENPNMRLLLGMCPTLAITTAAVNGFAMGAAVIFVLLGSCTIVSLISRHVPHQVRIATYIVLIAGFVTLADLFLAAYFPDISRAMGAYIALIVVNCIVLGRAEVFASKYPVQRSILDALGMGVGFTVTLVILASVREILGQGTFFGYPILSKILEPWLVMILPPGAFIALGLFIGLVNYLTGKKGEHIHAP
ncbi:MAG: electron transport complex subunit RsxE [Deltaproteobacteria bacterium]|nr:electron transport complex subunit RsxE [Deltaproteobacteria bacterium]